jgi:hypothetical protein
LQISDQIPGLQSAIRNNFLTLMIRPRIKIGNASRGSRGLSPAPPSFVLVLTGSTLTWSPRDPAAAAWTTNIYDLSGHLLDNSGSIDASHQSANIGDLWDPPPFQVSLQAQDSDGVNFGPESNKVTWAG